METGLAPSAGGRLNALTYKRNSHGLCNVKRDSDQPLGAYMPPNDSETQREPSAKHKKSEALSIRHHIEMDFLNKLRI